MHILYTVLYCKVNTEPLVIRFKLCRNHWSIIRQHMFLSFLFLPLVVFATFFSATWTAATFVALTLGHAKKKKTCIVHSAYSLCRFSFWWCRSQNEINIYWPPAARIIRFQQGNGTVKIKYIKVYVTHSLRCTSIPTTGNTLSNADISRTVHELFFQLKVVCYEGGGHTG